MKRPSFLTGAVIGGLFMLPVMAVLYVGMHAAGFTFLPYSMFDWTARTLPGPLITAGIDTMVAGINAIFPGSTSGTYKTAEQIMALVFLVVLGAVIGAAYFALLPRLLKGRTAKPALVPGIILGGLTAVVLSAIVLSVPPGRTADPITDTIWLAGVITLWGVLLGYAYLRLDYLANSTAPANVQAVDRRRFLIQMGGATAAITVVGAGVGSLLNRSRESEAVVVADASGAAAQATAEATPGGELLPNANDPVSPVIGTRLEVTPLADHYRIDINIAPPVVDIDTWTLPFTSALGGGDKVTLKSYTIDEVRAFPRLQEYITMACISNPVAGHLISTIKWTGLRLQTLLDDVGIPEGATHLKIYAADGFDEIVDLEVVRTDERVMLAYDWEDTPLTVEHGFPLRIHIPNRYGMKQPKWITEMEFLGQWEEGYWVRRGWSEEALVNATSVIDTIAVDSAYEQDGQRFIPIGGIAWAGDRRIAQVQVRVDDGEWIDARLRAPISDRTWIIWRFNWPFSAGQHRFDVRCIEADGTPQLESQRGVRPDGATGLHGITERFEAPAADA